MTLPMIGKLLGHTQVQTTQRYAHLQDDPLRAGLEQVAMCCGRSRGWFRLKRRPNYIFPSGTFPSTLVPIGAYLHVREEWQIAQ
jgi:hypothetical protein